MRVIALAAVAFVLASQSAPALAAGCTKGMLWPYVRANGDCLTDEEIKAGQKGMFSGQLDTNPDVANLKVETPAQGSGGSSGSGSLLGLFDFVPSLSGDNATYDSYGPAGLVKHNPANDIACNKGALWPFYRSPGDCLTETEKKDKGNTVFRADELGATPASAAAAPVTPANGAKPASAPPPAATCSRSVFWPFVRSTGDCKTDAEKKDQKSEIPQREWLAVIPASTQEPSPGIITVASIAGPSGLVACNKGVLWPFVREPGDCLTSQERKQQGNTVFHANEVGAAPAKAAAAPVIAPSAPVKAAAAPVIAPPAPAPALVAATPAATVTKANAIVTPAETAEASAQGCSKPILWPFVRSPGDCPTAQDRKNAAKRR